MFLVASVGYPDASLRDNFVVEAKILLRRACPRALYVLLNVLRQPVFLMWLAMQCREFWNAIHMVAKA